MGIILGKISQPDVIITINYIIIFHLKLHEAII